MTFREIGVLNARDEPVRYVMQLISITSHILPRKVISTRRDISNIRPRHKMTHSEPEVVLNSFLNKNR